MGCRRTRWCRHATRRRCGATRGWRRRRWSPRRCRRSWGGDDGRRPGGAAGGGPLVLRAGGAQAAGGGLEDRGVSVRGRAVGGFGDAGGWRGHDGPTGVAAGFPAGSVGKHRGEHVLPGRGSGSAGAIPPHAADGEAELADEHGHVDPVGVRSGRGSGRRGGADAKVAAAHVDWQADGLVGEAGWAVGGWDGAGGGVVYGSSVVADGGSGMAGGGPRTAVRVYLPRARGGGGGGGGVLVGEGGGGGGAGGRGG